MPRLLARRQRAQACHSLSWVPHPPAKGQRESVSPCCPISGGAKWLRWEMVTWGYESPKRSMQDPYPARLQAARPPRECGRAGVRLSVMRCSTMDPAITRSRGKGGGPASPDRGCAELQDLLSAVAPLATSLTLCPSPALISCSFIVDPSPLSARSPPFPPRGVLDRWAHATWKRWRAAHL